MSNYMNINKFVRLSSPQNAGFPYVNIHLKSLSVLRSSFNHKRNAPVQSVMMKSYGDVEIVQNDVATAIQRSDMISKANVYPEMNIHMLLQIENEK